MSSRHLKDKSGVHDLSAVTSITPNHIRDRDNNIKASHAVLHFHGGNSLHTETDYNKAVAAWTGEETPKKDKDADE